MSFFSIQVLALVVTEPVRVVFASGMGSTATIDPGTWLRSMQRTVTCSVVHEKHKEASNSPRFAMLTA